MFDWVLNTPLIIFGNVLPGHGRKMHFTVSVISPMQSSPPFCGRGLLQALSRDLTPAPQVAEHSV